MTTAKICMAMAALTDPGARPKEVAAELDVTTTTLYAYVNGDGSSNATAELILRRSVR